jgi:hypothetical protein
MWPAICIDHEFMDMSERLNFLFFLDELEVCSVRVHDIGIYKMVGK